MKFIWAEEGYFNNSRLTNSSKLPGQSLPPVQGFAAHMESVQSAKQSTQSDCERFGFEQGMTRHPSVQVLEDWAISSSQSCWVQGTRQSEQSEMESDATLSDDRQSSSVHVSTTISESEQQLNDEQQDENGSSCSALILKSAWAESEERGQKAQIIFLFLPGRDACSWTGCDMGIGWGIEFAMLLQVNPNRRSLVVTATVLLFQS